jgi:hypothetical protein
VVPEECILPNGYPDVCFPTDFSIDETNDCDYSICDLF